MEKKMKMMAVMQVIQSNDGSIQDDYEAPRCSSRLKI